MTFHRTIAGVMGVTLGFGLSLSASAQDSVLSAVSVRVNSGQMDAYMARVEKLAGVMDRLDVGASIEAWQVTAAGPATGATLVVLEYPSLTAYAENATKTEGDEEFRKLMSGLDGLRKLQSSSLYRQIGGPGREGDVPTGSILQTVAVRVEPGRLDDYVAKIGDLQKISKRLGSSGTTRVWQATAAGESTGTVVVGVIYKDLATYAEDSAKAQDDAEWQKLVSGLSDMRTIVSMSLARNVGP